MSTMKHATYKHGSASLERMHPSGMYLVQCRVGSEVHDKVRCDEYREAMAYFRAFCRIAKNA